MQDWAQWCSVRAKETLNFDLFKSQSQFTASDRHWRSGFQQFLAFSRQVDPFSRPFWA